MPGYIVETGNYRFEGFGLVYVLVKPNTRHVRLRWKGGMLHVSAWRGIPFDDVARILRDYAPAEQPPMYTLGQVIEMPDFKMEIRSQSHLPDRMLLSYRHPQGAIEVGTDWDMAKPDTIKQISKMLCRVAQSIAAGALIPQAKRVAERVGRAPLMWTISNGHSVLGHCNTKGVIALSYALMFYPLHLREYVICHELAHLSEMNHSSRFHEICDRYCQGREKELEAELKTTKIPIIR